jgi:hypothetical protein
MPFDQLKRREFITLGGRASATRSPVLACALPDRVAQWRIAQHLRTFGQRLSRRPDQRGWSAHH